MTPNLIALALCAGLLGGDAWNQFRGPRGAGVGAARNLPINFHDDAPVKKDSAAKTEDKDDDKPAAKEPRPAPTGPTNIAWRASLPGRGLSSPILVGDLVVVTASEGVRQDRLHVIAYDAESGKERWHRRLRATGLTVCHPKTCMAAPTPASDGVVIAALYSTNDLIGLDTSGNVKWIRALNRDYPNAGNSVGMASSLAIQDGVVIVQLESQGDAFVVGVDAATGRNRWKIERPRSANWTSPVAIETTPRSVLIQGGDGLFAIDPATGAKRWHYNVHCSSIPSAAVEGNVICVPSEGLTGLSFEPAGATTKVLWKNNRLAPTTPSPVVADGRVFVVGSGNILKAANLKTGELAWQLRLKGPFSSSPVFADGKLYCFSEDGLCQVVAPGEKEGKIIGSGELFETILCTPAVAEAALYIRSDGHLWKIAKPSGVSQR